MKTVIYKSNGIYCATTEGNYKARIQNARAIQRLPDFESAGEIIEYYCENFGSKPEDFIIVADENELLEDLHLEQLEQM